MTFEEIYKRIVKRWWIIITIPVLLTLALFPYTNSNSYEASITVGMSFNSDKYLFVRDDVVSGYSNANTQFSSFLANRFNTIEIQDMISKKSDLNISNFDNKKSFYSVTNITNGFVNLSFESDKEQNAKKFIEAVKETYKNLVIEWNETRLDNFKVQPMQNFTTNIIKSKKSTQLKILPPLAGILLALFIASVIPLKSTKK